MCCDKLSFHPGKMMGTNAMIAARNTDKMMGPARLETLIHAVVFATVNAQEPPTS